MHVEWVGYLGSVLNVLGILSERNFIKLFKLVRMVGARFSNAPQFY